MGTKLQAQAFLYRLSENTAAITCCKWKTTKYIIYIYFYFFHNSGRALVNRAGRTPVRAGRIALINMPSWNTEGIGIKVLGHHYTVTLVIFSEGNQ